MNAGTAPAIAHSQARAVVRRRFAESANAGQDFFTVNGQGVARCAAAMSERFFAGGRLLVLAFGVSASDAQHNAVEYVHPVLPGCRALPAIALSNDVATVTGILLGPDPAAVFEHQLRVLGRARDIALAFADLPVAEAVLRGLAAAREIGMLSVALLAGVGEPPVVADHAFVVPHGDSMVAQEVQLATYHILWELVHIILNHRGIPSDV